MTDLPTVAFRPGAANMARELGVTRQRVSKLLQELGLPTVVRYTPPANG